jgi:ATP-dependent Clp protease ATP-binding subunit ClpA
MCNLAEKVTGANVLVAIFLVKRFARYFLASTGITRLDVVNFYFTRRGYCKFRRRCKTGALRPRSEAEAAPSSCARRLYAYLNAQVLAVGLTPLIGRGPVERVIQTLCRRRKNENLALLSGPRNEGVGKTATSGLAAIIVEKKSQIVIVQRCTH